MVSQNMKNILIVEDEEDIAEMIKFELERRNYKVDIKPDGIAALKEIRLKVPDLMIADIIMPRMNGFMMMQELEKIGFSSPLIIVSGAYANRAKDFKTSLNVLTSIEKPFSVKLLLEVIDNFFKSDIAS